jgi:hypothetical protein
VNVVIDHSNLYQLPHSGREYFALSGRRSQLPESAGYGRAIQVSVALQWDSAWNDEPEYPPHYPNFTVIGDSPSEVAKVIALHLAEDMQRNDHGGSTPNVSFGRFALDGTWAAIDDRRISTVLKGAIRMLNIALDAPERFKARIEEVAFELEMAREPASYQTGHIEALSLATIADDPWTSVWLRVPEGADSELLEAALEAARGCAAQAGGEWKAKAHSDDADELGNALEAREAYGTALDRCQEIEDRLGAMRTLLPA